MIKFYSFFLLTIFFTATNIEANVITVKGYVTLANGSPAKNTSVRIAAYLASAATSCSEQTAVTNSDGFYSKEMTCTGGDIKKSRISVLNCDGQVLVQDKEVTVTKIVEANFVLCVITPQCAAKFTFEKLGPKKFRFNSAISVVSANDNVIERKWDFGDGNTSSDVSPAHEFAQFGNYTVCLNIKTAKGCESKFCVPVKVDETSQSNDASIIVLSLYPIPAHENLNALIYSKNNNIQATISVLDLYGKIQLTQQVLLAQGNNSVKTSVYSLPSGSYFYKITTLYGIISRSFFKL